MHFCKLGFLGICVENIQLLTNIKEDGQSNRRLSDNKKTVQSQKLNNAVLQVFKLILQGWTRYISITDFLKELRVFYYLKFFSCQNLSKLANWIWCSVKLFSSKDFRKISLLAGFFWNYIWKTRVGKKSGKMGLRQIQKNKKAQAFWSMNI